MQSVKHQNSEKCLFLLHTKM